MTRLNLSGRQLFNVRRKARCLAAHDREGDAPFYWRVRRKATSLKGWLCMSFFAQDRSVSSVWDDRGAARAPTTSNVYKYRLRTGVRRFTRRRTVVKDTKITLTRQILDVTEALGEPDI
jgi:hypothetical protein